MAKNIRIGPAHIFLGDPTQADGAGMQYMGYTRGPVTVSLGVTLSMGRADQIGNTPLADSVWTLGPAPVATLPLIDEEKEKLVKVLPGASLVGDALAGGVGFSKIEVADLDTLALVPVDQIDEGTNGIDAPDAIWFPAAVATSPGDLTFNFPDEGNDNANPHEVQVAALHRDEDQAQNALDEENGIYFIGPPKEFTNLQDGADPELSVWSLPEATP